MGRPQTTCDWDAVVYGDGSGEAQLLYVFRVEDPEMVYVEIPKADGDWQQLLGSDTAVTEPTGEGLFLHLPKDGSALWRR